MHLNYKYFCLLLGDMPSVENISLNKYFCGIHIIPVGQKKYGIENVENEKSKNSVWHEYEPKNMQHQGRIVGVLRQGRLI